MSDDDNHPQLEHPGLYSLWLYVDKENHARFTIMEVTATSTYGSPEGHVGVNWYSLNGSSNNRGYVDRQVPVEIQQLTLLSFWELVDAGKLIFLQPHPHEHFAPPSILQVGDRV